MNSYREFFQRHFIIANDIWLFLFGHFFAYVHLTQLFLFSSQINVNLLGDRFTLFQLVAQIFQFFDFSFKELSSQYHGCRLHLQYITSSNDRELDSMMNCEMKCVNEPHWEGFHQNRSNRQPEQLRWRNRHWWRTKETRGHYQRIHCHWDSHQCRPDNYVERIFICILGILMGYVKLKRG